MSVRRIAAVLIALVLTGLGIAAAAGDPRAVQAPLRISVTTTLPAWRAPGAPLTVSGFTGARRSVRLLGNGRVLGRTQTGPLGRFSFRVRPAAAGRIRLTVAVGAERRRIGSLRVRPVLLAAVGDVTFAEQVGPAVLRSGPGLPWRAVAGTLRAADVTTANLEGSVSARGLAVCCKQYTFRGPPVALRGMAQSGFDVVTLANNHSDDFGSAALLDTVRYAHAAGIQTVGAGANEAAARRRVVLERGGLRIAFLGYSDVNPAGFVAGPSTPGTARADVGAITADVRAAKRTADVVVCWFHWGTELVPQPDARQREFASACLGSGAALVLGAHPHVLGPVTRPGAHTLVAWTLGNFVFPASGAPARTAILEVSLTRSGVTGHRLLPALIEGFTPHLVR